jgi:hypothetical protein
MEIKNDDADDRQLFSYQLHVFHATGGRHNLIRCFPRLIQVIRNQGPNVAAEHHRDGRNIYYWGDWKSDPLLEATNQIIPLSTTNRTPKPLREQVV